MTESEFVNVVRSIREIPTAAPLEKIALDSLDLLELWCRLETITGRELTQQKYHPKTTLRQIYQMVSQ